MTARDGRKGENGNTLAEAARHQEDSLLKRHYP
jgi:hypothetical protein